MPPKQKLKQEGPIDPDEIEVESEDNFLDDIDPTKFTQRPHRLEITDELLEELKQYDIANYPIPEKYHAAYKMEGKQRLMIEKMVLENFKSYFGKQVIGSFHPHFSAIVGANGSGKSNIIDALMFVFGSRVAKIRSTTVKSLIHKSTTIKNINFCSVTIHFQLVQDEYDGSHSIVPGSKFTVKRTATNTGQSKYFYNKETVGRNELRNRLQEHGIDMDHNRFLILQGEVELISTMRPKAEKENDEGLLEYLDDIIGTSRLREIVRDLELKVTTVDCERQRQLAIVQESGQFKNELVGPIREMVKVLMMENKMAHCKHKILSVQIQSKEHSLVSSRKEQEEMNNRLIEEELRLQELIEGNNEAKVIMKEKIRELAAAQQIQRKQREQLDKEQMKLKRSCLNLEKAEKLLIDKKKELAKTQDNIKKLENRPSKNTSEAEKLKIELVDVKTNKESILPELAIKNKEANERTTELEKERNEIGSRLAVVKSVEDEANAKLMLAQSKQMRFKEPLEKAESRFNENQRNVEKAEEEYQAEERRIQESIEKLPSLEVRWQKVTDQFEAIKQEEQKLSSKFESYRNQYAQARSEHQSTQKSHWAVEKFMEEKRSGRIPGIFGRLGDLGNIDPKYDVAISTTCSALDMMVTDNYETTKQCLAFMSRQKNFPRKTMLALDKQAHLINKMQPVQTPMNLPRLFDLVKPTNPEVAPAFYFALRDTIVCDDIQTARRASTMLGKKWRVVTLGGEVVETTGAMTGGGNRVNRGRIGTNVNIAENTISEEDLAVLKRKLDECEKELDEIRRKLSQMTVEKTEATTTLERERNMLTKLQGLHRQHESDLKYLRSNNAQLKHDLKKAQLEVTEEKIAAIRAEVESLIEDRDQKAKDSSVIQVKYDKVSKQISSVYEKIAGDAQGLFDKWQKREKEIEKKLIELRKSSSKAEIELKLAIDNIEVIEKVIQDTEDMIEKHENDKLESGDIIERLEILLLEKEEIVKSIENGIKEEAENAEKNNEDEVNLKRKIHETKSENDELKEKIYKREQKIQEFIHQRDSLKLNDINDLLEDEEVKKPVIMRRRNTYINENGEEVEEEEEGDENPPEEENNEAENAEACIDDDTDSCCSDFEPVDETRLAVFINYTPEQIAEFDADQLQHVYDDLQRDKDNLNTNLNLNQLEEYRKRLMIFKREEAHLLNLTKAVTAVQSVYDRFVNQRLEEFNEALGRINGYLRVQYYALSLGGEAYLQAISPMDAYAEGINFLVRPRGKSWRQIGMTSGGEKTISSLSLVFALHQFLPTPFYVMDEIDAALDYRNVAMISKFVKEKTKNSQFIIISLRDNMYQQSNRLIGVFKVLDKAQTCILNHAMKHANFGLQTTMNNISSDETLTMPV